MKFTIKRPANGRVLLEMTPQLAGAVAEAVTAAIAAGTCNPDLLSHLRVLGQDLRKTEVTEDDGAAAFLNALAREAYQLARQKQRIDDQTPPESLLLHAHSELSEVYEDARRARSPEDLQQILFDPGGHGMTILMRTQENPNWKPIGVPVELADVLTCCFEYAEHCRIDLGHAYVTKLRHNRVRGAQPGGLRPQHRVQPETEDPK